MSTKIVDISDYINANAEAFSSIEQADLNPLLERIGQPPKEDSQATKEPLKTIEFNEASKTL